MKKSCLLFIVWSLGFVLGLYQMPLLENTIVKYNGYVNLTEYFPYSKDFQQIVENKKIALVASLDNNLVESENLLPLQITQVSSKLTESIEQEFKNKPDNIVQVESKCIDNCKVLMIGDSVMGDVSYSLERLTKKSNPTWKIINAHKVSSGLTNTTYYDWQKTAQQLLIKNKPDYVIIMMGTNDAQGIVANGKPYKVSDEEWSEEYGKRVNNFVSLIDQNNKDWFWVELPVVREPKFNARLQKIRNLQAAGAKNNLLGTENIFGPLDGTGFIDMKIRSNDGVHLNAIGADLVAKLILSSILKQ